MLDYKTPGAQYNRAYVPTNQGCEGTMQTPKHFTYPQSRTMVTIAQHGMETLAKLSKAGCVLLIDRCIYSCLLPPLSPLPHQPHFHNEHPPNPRDSKHLLCAKPCSWGDGRILLDGILMLGNRPQETCFSLPF